MVYTEGGPVTIVLSFSPLFVSIQPSLIKRIYTSLHSSNVGVGEEVRLFAKNKQFGTFETKHFSRHIIRLLGGVEL